MESERTLVERVLAGDRDAFRDLVRRYERLVRQIVMRMVRDPRDREEVVQDVFLRVYRGLVRFRFDAMLSTWIGRVAYRAALNQLEKSQPAGANAVELDALVEGGEGIDAEVARPAGQLDALVAAELRARVRAEVDALPPAYRTAVALYHFEGLGVGEIAAIMELPEGTVKSHLFRARRLLKESLGKHLGEGPEGGAG